MKLTLSYLLALVFLSFTLSCTTTRSGSQSHIILRQAENTPDAFSPPEGMTLDENSCKNPMIDRRDGTEIIMISAKNGEGTYKVPSGKYGVNKGELLRLDCRTGKVLGTSSVNSTS